MRLVSKFKKFYLDAWPDVSSVSQADIKPSKFLQRWNASTAVTADDFVLSNFPFVITYSTPYSMAVTIDPSNYGLAALSSLVGNIKSWPRNLNNPIVLGMPSSALVPEHLSKKFACSSRVQRLDKAAARYPQVLRRLWRPRCYAGEPGLHCHCRQDWANLQQLGARMRSLCAAEIRVCTYRHSHETKKQLLTRFSESSILRMFTRQQCTSITVQNIRRDMASADLARP